MIYVKHRQNKIFDLQKLDSEYGAEIDIRSYNKKLIIHHEPFIKGNDFEKWLKNYNHKFLIANVKEEGIEKKIISILNKYNIKKYFLLDVTIPMITKLNINKYYNIALRVSKYENILNIANFNKNNKWLWLDTFDNKIPINYEKIIKLKKNNYKFCLVSPELITNNKEDIIFLSNKYNRLIKRMDIICTKFPEYWESLKLY